LIQAETLELLEWSRLCQHLSTFAATKLGAVAARNLYIPRSKEESLKLLQQTQEIYSLEQKVDSQLSFEGVQDIGDSLERATLGGMLSGEELLNIATTLAGVRRLRRAIEAQETLGSLKELVAEVRTYPEIEQEIHHCIDDRGEVADRASAQLGEIRSQMKEVRERIYQTLQGILQRQGGALQEQVITQRGDRFVIPVKAAQKDQIQGIVHDISSSGATFYIEPQKIVDLGNKLRQYRRQEQREEEAILLALSQKIADIHEELEYLLAIATALDLATAKARYSLWLEANPPQFIDFAAGETVTLRQLRHPLLVWQEKHEEGLEVVPINVQINPQIRVVAITGPNTGGKTVTLKTLGLTALMAKVGLFIPAKEPVELPWFEQVLADIGDEQSLEQSLSTFSGHIKRIIRIIDALSPEGSNQCLVLLDEVGAGTDPAEGSNLAIALLKYLADHNLLTIATTHYGELKALKYQDSRFENASVEFNDLTLSPTYRLLWGIPGRSNALSIALRLGLKEDIVAQARELGGAESQEVNEVIAALEAEKRDQETKAKQAGKLLQETERFYSEVSAKAAALRERERELKLMQEKAVQDAISSAKAEIAQVIRQLQQGPQTAQNAQKATDALKQITAQRLPSQTQPPKPSYQPKVGEKIRLPNLGQTAEVLSINEEQNELTVRFGIMKMTLPVTEIESLDGKKVEPQSKPKPSTIPTVSTPPGTVTTIRTSQNTLDLRGSRIADAEIELDRAISRAMESGVLWIIHGKGTGKLRSGVHEFLRNHPQIERFELAPQNEGGSGVTVAYLGLAE
jgi:DNA mismatch repair protein MutS2